MKRLSRREKIIGVIAIITLIIIASFIVIHNIIVSNSRKISNNEYLATTANISSNLVAGYIKKGVTIGGVTGTLEVLDTSDANATPEDIMWGETAYVKGKKITGTKVVTVSQGKKSQKTFEENTLLIDDYGNTVKIPAGFKISSDSATSVTDGVVIEDVTAKDNNTKGSQFVWIPIGNINIDNSNSQIFLELGRYNFDSKGIGTLLQSADNWQDESDNIIKNTYYRELEYSSLGNWTAKDLKDFINKTTKIGGFYIGRFEAGDATATENPRGDNYSTTNPITCKAGVYPYNGITEISAAVLARGMYDNSNFNSDLINSYAWDTAIMFIQMFSGDTNYSNQVGRNTSRGMNKCGESVLDYNLDVGDETLDKRCNIYDMAGNIWEFTTETSSYTGYPCVARGGEGDWDGSTTSTMYYYDTSTLFVTSTFRVILYL